MDEDPTLIVERDGPVVVLTMNRPARKNALNIDMIVRLADAWAMIDEDDDVRCAILTGAGSSYCVGGDMADGWMAGGDRAATLETEERARDPRSSARACCSTTGCASR